MQCLLRQPRGRSYDRQSQSSSIPRCHTLLPVPSPCSLRICHVPKSFDTSGVLPYYSHAPPKSFPRYKPASELCRDDSKRPIPTPPANYHVPAPFDPAILYRRARRRISFVPVAALVPCSAKSNPDDDPEHRPPHRIQEVSPWHTGGLFPGSDNGM